MIEHWQALVLALIQGLTEFLPISSSAHLLLPTLLLGWPDQGLAFDVAVHFGTLLAVLLYFRRELLRLALGCGQGLMHRDWNDEGREVLFLGVATVPAVLSGLLLNNIMDQLRTVPVVICTTVFFALLLAIADRRASKGINRVNSLGAALFIGCAQAIAPIPGTSRSGITMTAGLFLGLSREAAARFSFLLSIPIIAGAALLKTLDLIAATEPVAWGQLVLGAGVAAVSAYLCIALFLALVERLGMMPFVVYRLLLGLLLAGLWWS